MTQAMADLVEDLADLVEAAEERNKDRFLSILPHCDQDKLRQSEVLHVVCRNGWLDVVKLLITISHMSWRDFRISPSTVRHHGGGASPIQLACTSASMHTKLLMGYPPFIALLWEAYTFVKYLVEHPDQIAFLSLRYDFSQTILFAYYNWDNDLMKYLIVKHKCTTIINGSTGDTVLHYACRDEYITRLRFFVEECECDSRVFNRNGHTLLYTVCSSYDPQKRCYENMLMYLTDLDCVDIKRELKRNEDGLNTMECAIMVRWEVAVKRLVALCDDQDDKYNIISFAYYHWDDSIMRYLIAKLGIVTNGITRNTLLHYACRDMSLDKIRFIAAEMSDVTDFSDIIDMNKNTLLHAFNGSSVCTPSSAVLSYLKSMCKYSINAFNNTPLEWAIVHQTLPMHALSTVRCLVDEYGSDELYNNPRILALAFQYWSDDIIKYLLVEMKCSPVTDKNNHGETILHMACRTGNIEQVKFLIETCHCKLYQDDETLIYAAAENDFDILQYLCIECNCYSDLSDHQNAGTTAMKSAIAQKEKSLAVVRHLVEKCKVKGNYEIMSFAWDNWCEAVMKYLIVDAKFDLTTDIHTGYTVLHHSVCFSGHFERMKFLIETCHCGTHHIESLVPALIQEIKKIDSITQLSDFSKYFEKLYYLLVKLSGCHAAIVADCCDVAKVVEYCYYMGAQWKNYNQHLARCCAQVIYLLIQNCIMYPLKQAHHQDDNQSICFILCIACKMWHKDALKCLLLDKKCNITVDWSSGDTVLHYACSVMNRSKLEFLLEECKCDINVSNLKGETILHTLCTPSRTSTPFHDFDMWFSIVKYIIETHNFHNLALQDNFGNTVFHLICSFTKYFKPFVFDYLLKYTHDLNLKNIDGYTVLHLLCCLASHDPLNIDLIRRLIQEGKCNPFLQEDSNMNSILHILASNWLAPVYSTNFLGLIHYLLYDCQLDSTSVNNRGDTVLHVVCHNFKGDITLIERVISTGKVNMLTKNNLDETPLMLLDNRCRELDNDDATKQVKQLIDRFGEVQLTHPIRSYVNVVLVGNPEVGKSTLCKVIESRKMYTIAAQYRNVKNVELHTAGIVPKIINDKDIGRIILHDLAGQAEYYSSHTAVLENLLQGSAAVFVAVVSLADVNCIKSFYQWFNILENVSHNALHQCHLIVVASHIDQSVVSDLNQLKQSISNLCSPPNKGSTSVLKSHGVFELDCRKLGGSYLTSFISTLSTACKSITDNDTREMSLYCHMLYDFFQRDGKSSYTLANLIELSENNNGLFLPKDIKHVESIVSQLSSTGLVVHLQSKVELNKSWVVADKSVLLSELNGVLFAPQEFKQYVQDIASNTGVVKLSQLYLIFSEYDPELLLQFLQYMELCSVISSQFLIGFNMQPLPNEQYIFVPTLIKSTDKPDISETAFKFGWCLRCTKYAFFISRFIHLVQLHLACKFSMKSASSSKFERLCEIWTKGIHWKDTKGVEALVEVADSNQTLIVLMSCEDGTESDMFDLIHDVLAEILSCKQQVMPRVVTYDFVINNSSLQRSLDSLDNIPLFSVQLLAHCFLNHDHFVIDNRTGKKQVAISKLSLGDNKRFFHAIFARRDPNCLANTEKMIEDSAYFQRLQQPLEADHVQYTENDTPINVHVGLQIQCTINTNLEGTKSKEAFASSNVMAQPHSSSLSPIQILKSHTPQLLSLISDPHKLAINLWSTDLLSDEAKDEVVTNMSLSRYRKGSYVLNEITRLISSMDSAQQIVNFEKFCQVLKSEGDPGLERISIEMITAMKTNSGPF